MPDGKGKPTVPINVASLAPNIKGRQLLARQAGCKPVLFECGGSNPSLPTKQMEVLIMKCDDDLTVCGRCYAEHNKGTHTCPLEEDLYDDYVFACNCCDKCKNECLMDT